MLAIPSQVLCLLQLLIDWPVPLMMFTWWNCLMVHFSECIPVLMWCKTVYLSVWLAKERWQRGMSPWWPLPPETAVYWLCKSGIGREALCLELSAKRPAGQSLCYYLWSLLKDNMQDLGPEISLVIRTAFFLKALGEVCLCLFQLVQATCVPWLMVIPSLCKASSITSSSCFLWFWPFYFPLIKSLVITLGFPR
jgi:hypothetical protein